MRVRTTWVAAALSAMHTATSHAWTVSSSTSAASAGEHETFAKTWTIAGADALQSLTVQSMGRVFIDYDASLGGAVAAKVVVSGDASDLIDAIEVVDDVPAGEETATGVKIHFQNDAFEGRGHLLTQVYVSSKHALRNVTMAWSSDVVVGDNVLVENDRTASVGLALIGSGDFFAGFATTDFSVGSIGMTVGGSGDIQLLAKSLSVADALDASVAGSGDIAVVADEVTVSGALSSLVGGSGDIFVQSEKLSAHNLSATVAGSGDVTYSRNGSCDDQTVVVVGSGDVSTASIVCANTFVNLVGSGDILVQTTESLTVASFFRGDIRYYGATPKTITASSLFDYGESHKQSNEIVRATSKNAFDEYDVKETPERTPVYVVVKTSRDEQGDEPRVDYDLELAEFDEVVVQQFLAYQQQRERESTKGSWTSVLAVGGVATVIAIFTVKRVSHQFRRHEYHSL